MEFKLKNSLLYIISMRTLIVDIKRNSLDDGPGIRTVIFFKGCPLSCVWCQNPETKSPTQEISFNIEDCLGCESCLEACEHDAIDFSYKYRIHRDKCVLCGNCIIVCPSEAIKYVGNYYDINSLRELILKDKIFYDNSGGGVTLSGGEPTFHVNYLHELLKYLIKDNIHSCLETCGYYNEKQFNKYLLPYLDLIYFDLKIYDSKAHKKYCGVSNELILQNFESIIRRDIEILPRIPLIPNVTATESNLVSLAEYLKSLEIKKIGLLPYNPLWLSKVKTIAVNSEYYRDRWLSKEEKIRIKEIFRNFEFKDF
ncbi:MAG: glycyl-radical enzyme activating protein [Promethearchaeota archaeon]|nr:MAG: glycyl-radical enzyme activating protein [Candidatus Lokiarchaeota archaeon]